MEYIKKQFKIKYTTGSTENENEYIIIPDLSVNYNVKFSLKSDSRNYGFFNVEEYVDGVDYDFTDISGTTYSRLSEIEKSIQTNILENKYFLSTDIDTDGLDLEKTVSGVTYVYYIDKIMYIDNVEDNITYFFMENNGLNSNNSIIGNYYKNPSLFDNISKPIINSDLFIDRPIRNIIKPFYRLKDINKMVDLENYAGGAYYNIYKND